MLNSEQGAVHEEDQEPAPEPATEDLPTAPAFEGSPGFMRNQVIYATLLHLNVCRLVMCT